MEVQVWSSNPLESCVAPSLVFFHGTRWKKAQTFLRFSKENYAKIIREMEKKRCWATPQGWILVQDRISKNLSLVNSITMAKVWLPPSKWFFYPSCSFILSSSPTSHNCMIMGLNSNWLYICKIGSSEWIKHKVDSDPMGIVALQGKFYIMMSQGELAVVEFSPHLEIRLLEVEIIDSSGMFCTRTHLLESLGEMYCILTHFMDFATDRIEDILIYRMDFSKMEWVKIKSIGEGRIFLLGDRRFAAEYQIVNRSNYKGDTIYITDAWDDHVYVFDMRRGIISAHRAGLKRSSSPCISRLWIMPPIS